MKKGKKKLSPNLGNYAELWRTFSRDAAQGSAILFLGTSGRVHDYTYAGLRLLTNKFANALENLGVKKGERFFGKLPIVLLAGFLILFMAGCHKTATESDVKNDKEQIMKYPIPNSIKAEHEELHRELEKAVDSGGATSEAAKLVAERLHEHFKKEEEYALPPLGLLQALAEGKFSEDMNGTIKLSDALKAELPQMLNEHKAIVNALDALAAAAAGENKADVVEFTRRLKMHAQNEEEVLYPAAILVGEFLKLRRKPNEELRRVDVHEMSKAF